MLLSPRLQTIYEMLPSPCTLADIGTDHCQLPVQAILSQKATHAFASDVRKGPLESARRNAEKYEVADRITLLLSDGMDGYTEAQLAQIDTVVFAGMGGILISELISRAPALRCKRLILQPMTAIWELKEWLSQNGFSVEGERICKEGDKFYDILCCVCSDDTAADYFSTAPKDALLRQYLQHEKKRLMRQKNGMEIGKNDASERLNTVNRRLHHIENILREISL